MIERPNRSRPLKFDVEKEIYQLESFRDFKAFSFGLLESGAMISSHGIIGNLEDFQFQGSQQEFNEWILQYPTKFWEYCRILDMLPSLNTESVLLDIGGVFPAIQLYCL